MEIEEVYDFFQNMDESVAEKMSEEHGDLITELELDVDGFFGRSLK